MENPRKYIALIAAVDVVVSVIPLIAVVYLDQSAAFFSFAAIIIAINTFFGFLVIDLKSEFPSKISSGSLRTAITSSIIIVYLYVVSLTTFFRSWSDEIQPLPQAMITNFTTIVGVVIAFYFTSSAIVERGNKEVQKKEN